MSLSPKLYGCTGQGGIVHADNPTLPARAVPATVAFPTRPFLPACPSPPPMFSDLRFALRSLGKSPGFSAIVIVTLALGIGACTTMFTIVHTVLLQAPEGSLDPARSVWITESRLPDQPTSPTSVPTFLDWKRLATSFEAITAESTGRATLTGGAEPLPLVRTSVTEGSQAVFTRRVTHGRWFHPEEFTPGKDKVVVLSYALWQRAFGGDPGIVSRTITLNDEAHTVIGITAPARRAQPRDVFMPMVFSEQARADRSARSIQVFGRLRSGVTLDAAKAEMDLIAAQLAGQHPETNKGWGARLSTIAELMHADFGRTLWTATAAVICVLLIACANATSLQMVRATTRHREIAIRAALGAGRGQLTRHLLSESMVLAVAGGAAGILLTHWALAAYEALAPANIRRNFTYELDGGMLAFALGLSLATGLLIGLLPAWLASRANLNHALKQATRGSTDGSRGAWMRHAMVATQVACAVVLLAGAGLFLASFSRLANVDPGFVPERAIGLRLYNLSAATYPTHEKQIAFVDDVLTRIRALPGVVAAGAALQLPINDSRPGRRSFALDEAQAAQPKSTWPDAAYYTASPDYFRAAGFRILRGRAFTDEDHATAQRVAIINETLARRHFGDRDPIGQTIRLVTNHDGPRVIIGVVSDIKQSGLSEDSINQVYEPYAQGQFVGTAFVVRHTGDPAVLIPLVKKQVYAVDKNQPITVAAPLDDLIEANIASRLFTTQLVTLFSGIALIIAAVGIYGVMAFSVSQRTTEIGIRMALGATSEKVLRHELARGMRVVLTGVAAGLLATLALSHLIASMLYHTSARDPIALGAITLVLAAVALFACWLPARRATRVDPIVALRAE